LWVLLHIPADQVVQAEGTSRVQGINANTSDYRLGSRNLCLKGLKQLAASR
jgi:hypothetical protein